MANLEVHVTDGMPANLQLTVEDFRKLKGDRKPLQVTELRRNRAFSLTGQLEDPCR